jgi:hypothetical protein
MWHDKIEAWLLDQADIAFEAALYESNIRLGRVA